MKHSRILLKVLLITGVMMISLTGSSKAQSYGDFLNVVRSYESDIFDRTCVPCEKIFRHINCGECETASTDMGIYTPIEGDDSTDTQSGYIQILPADHTKIYINPADKYLDQSKSLGEVYSLMGQEIAKLQKLQEKILVMNQVLQLKLAVDAKMSTNSMLKNSDVDEKKINK